MIFRGIYPSAVAVAAAIGGLSIYTAFAAQDKVQIEVTGNVKSYCSNSATTVSIHASDPSKAGTGKFSFTVDCNAPFQYTMQSQNGAMRLVDAPAGAPRDRVEVPYDVHVHIPLTLGGAIDDTCDSAAIRRGATTCRFTNSGNKIAIAQQAMTQVSWKTAQSKLHGGHYNDDLVIYVSVKP